MALNTTLEIKTECTCASNEKCHYCAWYDSDEDIESVHDNQPEESDTASTTSTIESYHSCLSEFGEDDNLDLERNIEDQSGDEKSFDEWNVPDPLLQRLDFEDSDWGQEQKLSQLQWQERGSESMVARRVAKLGIVVTCHVEKFFVQLESVVNAKVSKNRARRLREKRHQRTILVDTEEKLRAVLDRLAELDHSEPQVVIDCEGLNFKRTGTIDIMELYVRPDDVLYLLDVVALKGTTWSITATKSAFCLRQFLSSNLCKKIMWDLRMDAHILNNLYGIRLAGIIDSSLWAIAYRRSRNPSYDNFRTKIETMCKEVLLRTVYPEELESLEEAKNARFFLPPRPWAIRPLPESLIDYAADVKYMGMLYDVFLKKLGHDQSLVQQITYFTEQELEIACDAFWDATGEGDAQSPWSTGYLSSAREVLKLNKEDAALEAGSRKSIASKDIASKDVASKDVASKNIASEDISTGGAGVGCWCSGSSVPADSRTLMMQVNLVVSPVSLAQRTLFLKIRKSFLRQCFLHQAAGHSLGRTPFHTWFAAEIILVNFLQRGTILDTRCPCHTCDHIRTLSDAVFMMAVSQETLLRVLEDYCNDCARSHALLCLHHAAESRVRRLWQK